MKKLIILIVLILWGFIGASEINANPRISGYFYNSLSPYGRWIEIDYGVVVWRPTIMNRNWSPYTEGRWIWTSDGWYWQSYEPFGYITYHYGRWYFDDYYGWLWYPDYEWAPAWVEWRYDNDYIGWAPLHPYAVFSISIGIHYTTVYYVPYYHWHFVTYNHFYDPYVYKHCVAPRYKYRIYSKTRYRNNYTYRNGRVRNNGVDVKVIRNRTGQEIRQRDLQRVSDPRTFNNERVNDQREIRTFYRSREELLGNELRDVKIEKSNRKSSLDVRKIQRDEIKTKNIKKRTDREQIKQLKPNDKKRYSDVEKDRSNSNNKVKVKTFEERKVSGKDVETEKKTKNVNNTKLNRKVYQDNENKMFSKNDSPVKIDNNKKKEVKVKREKTKDVQTKTDVKKRVDKTFSEKKNKTSKNTNREKTTENNTKRSRR